MVNPVLICSRISGDIKSSENSLFDIFFYKKWRFKKDVFPSHDVIFTKSVTQGFVFQDHTARFCLSRSVTQGFERSLQQSKAL